MIRYSALLAAWTLVVVNVVLVVVHSLHFTWSLFLTVPLALVGTWDLFQTRHALLRNFPLIAHLRWGFETVRPEFQQYFVERDTDGRPFDRNTRSLVYEQSKNEHDEYPFGTELDVGAAGYEWFCHSIVPATVTDEEFRVPLGGPDCTQPYQMALLNISAMSYGALSANAILALNEGARLGRFAHDTGEGGLTEYHLRHGGDLVWEIGTGYFGCRDVSGKFDAEAFREKSAAESVKCISIKLSQGAKPGLGGVMPASKMTAEIAAIRGVPAGEKCVSPPSHSSFSTPRGLIDFVSRLRELSGGKPTGFKLCIGKRSEFLGLCKAMLDMGVCPDFIIVDGGEGGTGAAPLEFEDHVGCPLTEGLMFAHNALVGCGLRDRIRIGCSGKVASGFSIAKQLTLGADYCNSARGMMFALGCIQARRCQTNTCPTGVTTHDPTLTRGLVVPDKAQRVFHFQQNTTQSFKQLLAAMGLSHPRDMTPSLLFRRIDSTTEKSYSQLYPFLQTHQLLEGDVPERWREDWNDAESDSF